MTQNAVFLDSSTALKLTPSFYVSQATVAQLSLMLDVFSYTLERMLYYTHTLGVVLHTNAAQL